EAEPLADRDGFGVMPDGLRVPAVAPGDRAQVIERVGGTALVAGGARCVDRLGQARDGIAVVVGTAIRHAELNQRIALPERVAALARGLDDAADVVDGA